MDEKLTKALEEIGLTEGEAKVYVALLGLGSSTVGPIIKESKVSHSNVYEILNRLIEKGLTSFITKGKIKYFQSTPSSTLEDYLDEKKKEIRKQKKILEDINPLIEKLHASQDKKDAEVFIGKKGLRTAYEQLYHGATKNDEEIFLYTHEKEYEEESEIFYNSITDIAKQTKIRGVCNLEYKETDFAKKAKHLTMKYVDFPIPGIVDILKNRVLIVSWKRPITAILIYSEDIANNFRDYFEDVWKKARP